jgi:hypothetical protein
LHRQRPKDPHITSACLKIGSLQRHCCEQIEQRLASDRHAHTPTNRGKAVGCVGCIVEFNAGVIDKGEGLDRNAIGRFWNERAGKSLKLEAKALVADNCAGIIAATNSEVTARILLISKQAGR